ncbi:MAG: penicillin-binding transpeptidase domain-containing protein [Leptospirales bacterium]|nr:penicillin-binding transpeptidase domain-containing protein [Leptospirales bacterium]
MNIPKQTLCVALCLLISFLLQPVQPAFAARALDEAIGKYERENSLCAALIMDSESGMIAYIYNRSMVIEKQFPPGSLLKPLSALVLLEHADKLSFNANEIFHCGGKFFPSGKIDLTKNDLKNFNLPKDNYGLPYFRCSLGGGHGDINLRDAISRSCNSYFLTAASRRPYEFFGLLRSAFNLERKSGALPAKNGEIPPAPPAQSPSRFQLAASAIGEGGLIMLSPIKVAQIYAGIFNGSPPVPFEPPLAPAKREAALRFSEKNLELVRNALTDVTLTGTLKKLTSPASVQVIAGKTGSATAYGKLYKTHGWNAIYFAFMGRKYILVSFVEMGSGAKEALALSEIILANLDGLPVDR